MFVDYQETSRIYANLSSQLGGFVEEVDERHPRAQRRVNKNNRVVYEVIHPAVYGYVQSIRLKEDKDYGDKYMLAIESPDPDENGNRPVIITQFQRDSYICRSLLNQLVGLSSQELSRPITIDTRKKKYAGKEMFFVNIYLGRRDGSSQAVNPKVPKTSLPEPKKVTFKGKDIYDYTEAQEMIEQHLSGFHRRLSDARRIVSEQRGPTRPARNFRDEAFGDPQTEEVDGSHYCEEDDAPEPSMSNPIRPADELFNEAAEMLARANAEMIAEANGLFPLYSSEDEKKKIESYRQTCREAWNWLKARGVAARVASGTDAWGPREWGVYLVELQQKMVDVVRAFARKVEESKGAEIFSDADRAKLERIGAMEVNELIAFHTDLVGKDEIPF